LITIDKMSSHNCRSITKEGKRCKNMIKSDEFFCHLHNSRKEQQSRQGPFIRVGPPRKASSRIRDGEDELKKLKNLPKNKPK
jgi:hypothetical protein